MSKISPEGMSWDEFEKTTFTPEEIEASNKRVAKICKKIDARIAAEEIAKLIALEKASGDKARLKELKKLKAKVRLKDPDAVKTVLEMTGLTHE